MRGSAVGRQHGRSILPVSTSTRSAPGRWTAVACVGLDPASGDRRVRRRTPRHPQHSVAPTGGGDFNALMATAQAALDANNLAAAEQSFRAAVSRDPKSAQAQFGLGQYAGAAGQAGRGRGRVQGRPGCRSEHDRGACEPGRRLLPVGPASPRPRTSSPRRSRSARTTRPRPICWERCAFRRTTWPRLSGCC